MDIRAHIRFLRLRDRSWWVLRVYQMHFREGISGHLDLWLRERIDGHIDPWLSTGSGCTPLLVEMIMRGFPATCTVLDNSNDRFCRNPNAAARSFLVNHLGVRSSCRYHTTEAPHA
jgi:hypothetical protein